MSLAICYSLRSSEHPKLIRSVRLGPEIQLYPQSHMTPPRSGAASWCIPRLKDAGGVQNPGFPGRTAARNLPLLGQLYSPFRGRGCSMSIYGSPRRHRNYFLPGRARWNGTRYSLMTALSGLIDDSHAVQFTVADVPHKSRF